MQEHHHHRHREHEPHQEIAVAAYYIWQKEGSPFGDERLALENWYEGEAQVERRHERENE